MNPNTPIYVVLLIGHAGAAIFGFGTLALSGYYASRNNKETKEAVAYFSSRRTGPKILVFIALALGVILLLLSSTPSHLIESVWLQLGIFDYIIAAMIGILIIWPSESRLRQVLRSSSGEMQDLISDLSRRIVWAGVTIDVLLIVALVLMITQPG